MARRNGLTLDGEMVEFLLRDRGVTKAATAKALGKDASILTRWISGERGITWPEVQQLGSVLKVSPLDYRMLTVGRGARDAA